MIHNKVSNKLSKKLLVFALCTVFITPINHHAFAESLMNEDSTQHYEEVNVSQVDFTVENLSTITTNELKTNAGKPIESNIFKDNEDGGNNLFAICTTIIEGVPCESFYFVNEESIPENELRKFVYDSEAKKLDTYKSEIDKISNKESVARDNVASVAASSPAIIKAYTWSFNDSDIFGNSSGGSLTVGLNGLGIPSMQYSFSIAGFSLTDYSSLCGNYGRWHFWDGISNLSNMVTQSGVRVTNTLGSFAIDLSQTTDINANSGGTTTHYTGIIQILLSDR